MSEALAREFGCPQPTVVYNAFPWSARESVDGLFKDRRDRRLPSIHWFSQTLGHNRGLDDLIAALPLLKHEAEIHLRGKPVSGFENWLAHRVPEAWRGRIMVHEPVRNTELLSRITEHDIGFAGETPVIRSRDLTVTNKILYYLLAGLAVLASNTAGQREVAALAPGGVFLYPRDTREPGKPGRLRLLYEANPIAFIVVGVHEVAVSHEPVAGFHVDAVALSIAVVVVIVRFAVGGTGQLARGVVRIIRRSFGTGHLRDAVEIVVLVTEVS